MNDGILHEKDEPKSMLPPPMKMCSLLDILGGGIATCDRCGRWQSFSAITPEHAKEELAKSGWTFPDKKELCPKCSPNAQ